MQHFEETETFQIRFLNGIGGKIINPTRDWI